VDAAREHLLAAGGTPGSPQLYSFGPSMALATELLDAGEREAVREYFRLCAAFWKQGHGLLERWAPDVVAGKVPDFKGQELR
jgi:hypothetical protein